MHLLAHSANHHQVILLSLGAFHNFADRVARFGHEFGFDFLIGEYSLPTGKRIQNQLGFGRRLNDAEQCHLRASPRGNHST